MKRKRSLGNPLLLAAGSQVAKSPQGQKVVKEGSGAIQLITKNSMTLGKILIGLTAAIALWIITKKIYKTTRYNNWRKKASSDVNVQAAISIYDAIPAGLKKGEGSLFNPFGFISDLGNQIALLWTPVATNTIVDVADKINDLQQTVKAFKIFYEQDLYELLHKALSNSDYDRFYQNAIKQKQVTTESTDTSIAGKIGITKKQTTGKYYYQSGQNVAGGTFNNAVPVNAYVGRASGKVLTDKNTGVKYMELMLVRDKNYILYLPKNDIKSITDADFNAGNYNKTWTIS